jgi:hypothetical protein
VGVLLKSLGYSLKTNIKRLIGKPHLKRDRQYRLIQRYKSFFLHHKQPVVSIDAKKSELIGNFKNHGTRYCIKADEVNTYDFPSDAECKAIPYGISDQNANHALVMVGKSAFTAMFAVNSIRSWWRLKVQRDIKMPNIFFWKPTVVVQMDIDLVYGNGNYKNWLMKVT